MDFLDDLTKGINIIVTYCAYTTVCITREKDKFQFSSF